MTISNLKEFSKKSEFEPYFNSIDWCSNEYVYLELTSASNKWFWFGYDDQKSFKVFIPTDSSQSFVYSILFLIKQSAKDLNLEITVSLFMTSSHNVHNIHENSKELKECYEIKFELNSIKRIDFLESIITPSNPYFWAITKEDKEKATHYQFGIENDYSFIILSLSPYFGPKPIFSEFLSGLLNYNKIQLEKSVVSENIREYRMNENILSLGETVVSKKLTNLSDWAELLDIKSKVTIE